MTVDGQGEAGTGSIRTPDQRLRVFVSSTLQELAPERAAVERAITALRLTPVMFELGARPHPPQELYRAYLAQSDIFIGLYWQNYGWVGPGMDISGLEDELRLSDPFPRLLYLKEPAPDREPALTGLIEGLQREGADAYRTFRTPRELTRLVRDDLALLLSERFAASSPSASPAPGAGQPAAPAAHHHPVERTLPVSATSLIGREPDIGAVAQLLTGSDARLVTLTGPGGVGKTRLAVAVALRLEEQQPGRAVFVPLASVTEPDEALRRIASAVGAAVEGARSPLEVLVEHLGGADTVLVLDNLEQVTGVAADLDQLLARCGGLRLLVTSRTVLRLRAERDYPVSPLAVPAFTETPPLEELAQLPAVQLFADRARAVRYDFTLTDENAPAIAELCRRLDGLPLAIEIAAARTRLLDPSALLARLGDRLDALGSGPVDLPERQRTLQATVAWSIDLLDADEQRMLDALSVFVDGWTIDAAVQVAALDELQTLDLLDALAGHSLVSVDASAMEPRFRMLVAVRELAADRRRDRPDAGDIERRHAQYFTGLVIGPGRPTEGQAAWAAQLGRDEENLRAAVRWCFAHDVEPLPELFVVLWLFWQIRDRMPEGRAWLEELQRRAGELDERGRAELLLISAVTAVEVGDDESGLSSVDGLRRLVNETDEPFLACAAQLALSWVVPLVDDLDGALVAATSALDGFRPQGDPFLAFAALTAGMLEMRLGRPDAARGHLDEVGVLAARSGNQWLEAAARTQLASLAVGRGDLDGAAGLLAASVAGADGADLSTSILTFALVSSAELALAQQDAARAATALGAAAGLRDRSGLRAWPMTRPGEADLAGRVGAAMDPAAYQAAFDAGTRLTRRATATFIRNATPPVP